jgi:hypothetical protein
VWIGRGAIVGADSGVEKAVVQAYPVETHTLFLMFVAARFFRATITSDLQEAWHLVQNWLTKRWIAGMNLFGDLTDEQASAAKQMAD